MPPFLLDQITDHQQQAEDRLTAKLGDKPNVLAVLDAYVEQVQDLEDDIYQNLNDRMFDPDASLVPPLVPAANAQLDQYGKLVGLARNGLSDDDYRAAIRTQLLANRSSGTIDNLLTVVSRYLAVDVVLFSQLQPAQFQLFYALPGGTSTTQRAQLAVLLPQVAPAGVGWDVVEYPGNLDTVFRFDTPGQGYDQGEYAGYLFAESSATA